MTAGRALVIMGVSGAGKSTLAMALANALGFHYIEGDDLHNDASRGKMAAGIALDDDDRWPWLARVGAALSQAALSGGGVVSCSALKRRYRDMIGATSAVPVTYVFLDAPADIVRERVSRRESHYMPASLVQSQIETLEPPEADESFIAINARWPTAEQVKAIISSGFAPPPQR